MNETLELQRLREQLQRTRRELLDGQTTEERRTELRGRRERLLDRRDQLEGLGR